MNKRQDRQGVRRPADLEQKYNFDKRFNDAMEAVADLDKKLDESEIFDRLTDGGRFQGVFRGNDGNIYINASYLVTGILKSRDGKSFYLDLDNGILKGEFTELSISGRTLDSVENDAQTYADQAAQNAVNAQTQIDVFNKLTDNGNARGIYYQDGDLYINANYLIAGIIRSIDDKFYLNLENGYLKADFTDFAFGGKTASWKDNGDGTYTLIGTDPTD